MQILEIFSWLLGWKSPYLKPFPTIHFTFRQFTKRFYFKCIFLKTSINNNKKTEKLHGYTTTQCDSHTKGSHDFREMRGNTLFDLRGPRLHLHNQINVGILFAKDNLPQLDGLDAEAHIFPQGRKMWATEQGILVSTFLSSKAIDFQVWVLSEDTAKSSVKKYWFPTLQFLEILPCSIIFPVLDHLVCHFLCHL